ncbi:hypothetical protein OIU77_005919 [Salix suchowensis]|uniref:Uncharacterized protein n=1 Tax=Salix suchowensis TaxID=1278906 RepID=A0ABQ9ASA4_9ROSI|nr:hypothetical protein OIU77_005919 [Salix suchowensis]
MGLVVKGIWGFSGLVVDLGFFFVFLGYVV